MRVVQVVPRIAAVSSGPSISVPKLSASIAERGHDVKLMVLEPLPKQLLYERTAAFPCSCFPGSLRLGVSPALRRALFAAAREVDVIHTNSLWMMPNVYPGAAVAGTRCRSVISPRGTLSPWARRRAWVRKQALWHVGQGRALREADCIHVTSYEELADVRDVGLRNPVVVVPNGVCCPPKIEHRARRVPRTLLFLARIHPTKGVDVLLNAWRVVSHEFPGWQLTVAGPLDSAHARQIQQLAANLSLPRIVFKGEVSGIEKTETYASADLYVLPTHSENFGISVAEALAHGLPAIVFHGAPWEQLNSEAAGWWIEPGIDSLVATLRLAMSESPEKLRERGEAGRRWMQRDFSWPTIGQKMEHTYRWLLDCADRPYYVDVVS